MMAEGQMAQEAQAQDPLAGVQLDPEDEQELTNIRAIREEYQVSENIASAMREAEMQGASEEQIMGLAQRLMELEAQNGA
jgi:hypothetical protein